GRVAAISAGSDISAGVTLAPRPGKSSIGRETMTYRASDARYGGMQYRKTGKRGLKLPVISLGLWQNVGGTRDYPSAFEILSYAFDKGVTHFDLANNYGPPPGSAEELFGDVMARDFRPYRDEM